MVLFFFLLYLVGFAGFLVPQLRVRMLDHPNFVASQSPTPRGGGLYSFHYLTYSLIAFLDTKDSIASLPLLAAPLSIVGLVDDRYNLPASWRYGVQLLTAVLIFTSVPL